MKDKGTHREVRFRDNQTAGIPKNPFKARSQRIIDPAELNIIEDRSQDRTKIIFTDPRTLHCDNKAASSEYHIKFDPMMDTMRSENNYPNKNANDINNSSTSAFNITGR